MSPNLALNGSRAAANSFIASNSSLFLNLRHEQAMSHSAQSSMSAAYPSNIFTFCPSGAFEPAIKMPLSITCS